MHSKPARPPMLGLCTQVAIEGFAVQVEGYSRPNSEEEAAEALDNVRELWISALAWLLAARTARIERMVFEWDRKAQQWRLNYMILQDHTVAIAEDLRPILREIIDKAVANPRQGISITITREEPGV